MVLVIRVLTFWKCKELVMTSSYPIGSRHSEA